MPWRLLRHGTHILACLAREVPFTSLSTEPSTSRPCGTILSVNVSCHDKAGTSADILEMQADIWDVRLKSLHCPLALMHGWITCPEDFAGA